MSYKRLISKIYKQLIQLKTKSSKPNNPIKKWSEDLNRQFPKKDMQIANRHMKRCSSYITRELQMKTTRRCTTQLLGHSQSRTLATRCWQGYRVTRTLLHYWWEFKMVQPLWKTVWQVLTKPDILLPYDLAIIFLGISQRSWKLTSTQKTTHGCL